MTGLYKNVAERNKYIHKCQLYLFSKLGAIVQKGILLYWCIMSFVCSKIFILIRAFFHRRILGCHGLHSLRNTRSGRWY